MTTLYSLTTNILMREFQQEVVDTEDAEAFPRWKQVLESRGVKVPRFHRKSDGSFWYYPPVTAEEVRSDLIRRANLTDDDLADYQVRAEVWRLVGIHMDNPPVYQLADSMKVDVLQVVRDRQRQMRTILPIYKPVTDDELAELKALYDRTTPGSYTTCQNGECICGSVYSHELDVLVHHAPQSGEEGTPVPTVDQQKADAKFIAAIHNMLPRLIATIEKMRKATEERDYED